MQISEIRGRREYSTGDAEGGSTRYVKLVPRNNDLPALDFEKGYAFDEAFWRWYNGLSDLDADPKSGSSSNFGLV